MGDMLYVREAVMKKLRISICVFLSSLCVGCIMIPIPTPKHTPAGLYTRGAIEANALEFMRVGSTSREQVLLKLGESDAVREHERYLLYRWVTVRGYLLVKLLESESTGHIGKNTYELLIEFDDEGLVKRFGDIRTWAAKVEGQEEPPLGLATPIEIPVSHLYPGLFGPVIVEQEDDARLILGKDFFELRESWPSLDFRISPEKIVLLRERSYTFDIAHDHWAAGKLTYDIHFSERTAAGKTIGIRVDVFSLLPLLEYLRENCPNLELKN